MVPPEQSAVFGAVTVAGEPPPTGVTCPPQLPAELPVTVTARPSPGPIVAKVPVNAEAAVEFRLTVPLPADVSIVMAPGPLAPRLIVVALIATPPAPLVVTLPWTVVVVEDATVREDKGALPPGMRGPFWFCALTLFLLYLLLLTARMHLERQRTALDQLYLAQED